MKDGLKSLDRPLLLLVAFNMIPHFFLRPPWAMLVVLLFLGYRVAVELLRFPMPPRLVQWLAQGASAGLIYQNFHSLFGDQASGTLLTFLVCLKTYELRAKRDYFVAALLCFLVLMSYLLVDQSLVLALFSAADALFIFAFLYALESERWSWGQGGGRVRASLGLALKTLPLLVACFLLFPRFSTGFGTGAELKGRTGISDELRPGTIAQLVRSDELVFRASYHDGVIPPRGTRYWRAATLDVSNGLNWDRSKTGERVPIVNSQGRGDIEVYLEPGFERYLFAPDDASHIFFEDGSRLRGRVVDGDVYELDQPLNTRSRYYVELETATKNRALEDRARYLEVKDELTPRTEKLLRSMRGLSASAAVSKLAHHFQEGGYEYSLEPPRARSLDDFLFRTRIGFCEHFAGTMATLLRHLQIPARVVVGFQGGTPSLLENYVSIRAQDAHAWVEYFDDQRGGWRRIDPTAQVAPSRLSQGSATFYLESTPSWGRSFGLERLWLKGRALFDEVEGTWLGFLLRFDLNRQKQLLARFGMDEAIFRALPVFLILSVALILAVLYFLEAQKRLPLSREDRLYGELLRVLKRFQVERAASEGPLQVMDKVRAHGARLTELVIPIMEPLILARYGGRPLERGMADKIQRQLSLLRRAGIKPQRPG